jgi:uncharacterized membrane protein YjfL (UPF0719 family)
MAEGFIAAVIFGLIRYGASAVLAVLSIYFGVRAFDKLTEEIGELEELRKGNAAVGILVAAIIICIAAVVRTGVAQFAAGIQPNYALSLIAVLAAINVVKLLFGLFLAILTIFISLNLLDALTRKIDETRELKKGNIAIAILIAGVLIAVSIVVGASMEAVVSSQSVDSCIIALELEEAGLGIDASGCIADAGAT